jgi:flagellar hook protein FlgE
MNVIANDIANVNTAAYKQSNVTFKDALYNTIRSPAPETPGLQYGMGVQVGTISKDFGDGVLQMTGVSSNLAITGNGFFVMAAPGAAAGTTDVKYTRAGDFVMDPNLVANDGSNYMMNSSGNYLQGLAGVTDATGLGLADMAPVLLPAGTVSYSVSSDGILRYTDSAGVENTWGMIPLALVANNTGMQAEGDNLYAYTSAAGAQSLGNPNNPGVGQLYQGYLEGSNVELASEFTEMIVTERGYQANSRTITTSDEMLQELLSLKR